MMMNPAVTRARIIHIWTSCRSPTCQAMKPRAVKQMIMVPAARPLNPSIIFVAFAMPATANMVNAMESGK